MKLKNLWKQIFNIATKPCKRSNITLFPLLNLSPHDLGQREKINLYFYFHTSLWCFQRFYEGFKGLNYINEKTHLATEKDFVLQHSLRINKRGEVLISSGKGMVGGQKKKINKRPPPPVYSVYEAPKSKSFRADLN